MDGKKKRERNQIQWKVHGPHFCSVISLDYVRVLFPVALGEGSYCARTKTHSSDQWMTVVMRTETGSHKCDRSHNCSTSANWVGFEEDLHAVGEWSAHWEQCGFEYPWPWVLIFNFWGKFLLIPMKHIFLVLPIVLNIVDWLGIDIVLLSLPISEKDYLFCSLNIFLFPFNSSL